MSKQLTVGDIMTSPVVTVLFSDPVIAAVNKMITHDIGAVIVMMGGQPAGIITERDILKKIIMEGRDPKKTMCQDIMTKPLVTVESDTPVARALALMKEKDIRRLPVVKMGRLVGIVTEKDIIRKII
ncbi:MAG: histidine kinase [Thermofilum sp. ex4484_79]|nr:MAG: histidine kinase [Thermofilum sp. ex4484_79]HDD63773.1 CBS domain-containing protein [Thermoprotei archaeon]